MLRGPNPALPTDLHFEHISGDPDRLGKAPRDATFYNRNPCQEHNRELR